MAAKSDSAHPPAAAPAAAPGADAADAPVKTAGGPLAAFLPLIAVIVLAPTLTWAIGQFVLLPQLKKQLAAPVDAHAPGEGAAAEAPAAEEKGKGGKEGKGEKKGAVANEYIFENVVVNLAGTMGTRYLKTTFAVSGDASLHATFESKKPQLLDITLNVLSALSLTDLEEAGARNLIREKLISAYNQALGKKVVDQIYFSDFVVQ